MTLGAKIQSLALFACLSLTFACSNTAETSTAASEPDFKISLAQWSLHRSIFGESREKGWLYMDSVRRTNPSMLYQGEISPTDFPRVAKEKYGVDAIELVNQFYWDKVDDDAYWADFKATCDELGVKVLLIMCDGLGNLGDSSVEARTQAIENHYRWVDIAAGLGAHSIRVNAAGRGTAEEVATNAADGLGRLSEYAATKNINVIVENHGGFSSDGQWLSGVMKAVDKPNCGTLPDFGNFCLERGENWACVKEYDRYQGMKDLMPFAKGVSAKSHQFDENGNEVNSDFVKIMQIVKESGFKGYVGIEYEGQDLTEDEGIRATKALLEKVIADL